MIELTIDNVLLSLTIASLVVSMVVWTGLVCSDDDWSSRRSRSRRRTRGLRSRAEVGV
jgi:hypothetical protein